MIHITKKSDNESNESLMRRFTRKAIVVFKQTKGRDVYKKKPNRKTRREHAVRRARVRAAYDLAVRRGDVKIDTFTGRPKR